MLTVFGEPVSHQYCIHSNQLRITNMLSVQGDLVPGQDDGLVSRDFFVYFAKSFDRVPHSPLRYEVESHGTRGQTLPGSFLRRELTVIADPCLSQLTIKSGGAGDLTLESPESKGNAQVNILS